MSEKVIEGFRIQDLGFREEKKIGRTENMDHKKIRCFKCKR